jgi:hypothetical protein
MDSDSGSSITVNIRSVTVVSIASFAYLLFSAFLVGFKSDQVALVFLFNLLFYASAITRKFVTGFTIFVGYWIIFDYMKAFPNYEYSTVHIADVYNFEKHLFGIHYQGQLLTPNEYLRIKSTTFLDVMAGFFYLCWIPVPMGFALYLFLTRRRQFLLFLFTFVLVNFVGFIVYYTFPVAPPWYVQDHGFTFHELRVGSTAGLAKFDAYFNVSIFKSLYTKGSNVFAAMPSLHSSYPIIVLYYALKNKVGKATIFFVIVMLGIWFSAVYLSHHYIVDVLGGILCAVIGISLFNLILSKVAPFRKFVDRYENLIK